MLNLIHFLNRHFGFMPVYFLPKTNWLHLKIIGKKQEEGIILLVYPGILKIGETITFQ